MKENYIKLLLYNKNNFILIILLILLKNNHIDGLQDVIHHKITKRMELESCIGRFDVHDDTIIRTEESRSIGAKFLDNADLGSREECLRLCCETDGCDVFVFEEKSQGTCFLFECGPPENFRCKFTRHSNYSSAVLSPMRQVVPPPPTTVSPQIQLQAVGLSQHELELDNLKEGKSYRREKITTNIPPLGIRIKEKSTTRTTTTPTQCSRFQFTCHSGECIAVYNACDGIPQCEDGTDEGPECPATSFSVTKIPPLGVAPSIGKTSNSDSDNNHAMQQEQLPSRDLIPPSNNQETLSKAQQISQSAQVSQISRMYQQQQQQQQQDALPRNREDPMTAPQWPLMRQQSGTSFIEPSDSHIFNHKGGIQVSSNNMGSQYSNSIHDNGYGPSPRDGYMMTGQDNYRNILNQQPPSQQQQQQWLPDHRIPSRMDWPQQQLIPQSDLDNSIPIRQPDMSVAQQMQQQQIHEQQQQQQQQQAIQQQQRQDWPVHPILPVLNNPDNPIQKQLLKEIKTKEKESKSENNVSSDESDDDSEYEEEDYKTTEAPKKKPKKHKNKIKEKADSEKLNVSRDKSQQIIKVTHDDKIDHPMHEQLKIIKNDLEIEFADHDGPAERPGGAVLSLTLGIIVTAALAILVGCRMRAVGRRIRRSGKSPYAHDSDFLVNGMYL